MPVDPTPAPGGETNTPAAPQTQTITIPIDQLNAFTAMQTRLAKIEAEQASRDEAAKAEQVRLLAQKGEVEAALKAQREDAERRIGEERTTRAQIEERAKRYALDGELSRVLAGQPLVPGGAEQLTQLWRNQFTVEAQGDSFTVRTPQFQSVQEFVAGTLAKPEFTHFLRPQGNPAGGTAGQTGGAGLAAPTTPANPAVPPTFKNLGEAAIAQFVANRTAKGTEPQLNPSLPFGLKRSG
jgi:hypothetical protein